MSRITHLLVDIGTIKRRDRTPQNTGFVETPPTVVASGVKCMRVPITASEQELAAVLEIDVTHSIYFEPGQSVQRDDDVEINDESYHVNYVVEPSRRIYRKALAEVVQTGI